MNQSREREIKIRPYIHQVSQSEAYWLLVLISTFGFLKLAFEKSVFFVRTS